MANFTDLIFRAHTILPDATQARFDFPNGYAISVITGPHAYTSPATPYEAAVIWNGDCCYNTPLTDDVLGYLDADGVTKLMAQVEALITPKE